MGCAVPGCAGLARSKRVPLCLEHRLCLPTSQSGLIRTAALTVEGAQDDETRSYALEQLNGYMAAALRMIAEGAARGE